MKEVLDQYAKFLWEYFQSDMNVFGSKWTYIPLLIPFFFYCFFFMIKWYILLFPLTLPLSIIMRWTPLRIVTKSADSKFKKVENEFTSNEILTEMDGDMEDSGMAQGEIESNINHWRNKYLITRRKNFSYTKLLQKYKK
jgi:hypothetical protein